MPAHNLARKAQPDAGAFAGLGLGTCFGLLGGIEGNENFFHGFFGDSFSVVNYINGEPVHDLSDRQKTNYHRNHIGFVFQNYRLNNEMTVYENIEMPLPYRKVKSIARIYLMNNKQNAFLSINFEYRINSIL